MTYCILSIIVELFACNEGTVEITCPIMVAKIIVKNKASDNHIPVMIVQRCVFVLKLMLTSGSLHNYVLLTVEIYVTNLTEIQ